VSSTSFRVTRRSEQTRRGCDHCRGHDPLGFPRPSDGESRHTASSLSTRRICSPSTRQPRLTGF
jgi:hypothetical protein